MDNPEKLATLDTQDNPEKLATFGYTRQSRKIGNIWVHKTIQKNWQHLGTQDEDNQNK
jgi:hypothetical protein